MHGRHHGRAGHTHYQLPGSELQAFLFRELRDTLAVKSYVMRILNRQFLALKTNNNIGKILERVTVLGLSFGVTTTPVPLSPSRSLSASFVRFESVILVRFFLGRSGHVDVEYT